MNRGLTNALAPGIYRLHWKDGSAPSLAAVGMCRDGLRWFAPINWLDGGGISKWHLVERAELVMTP